MKKNNLLKLAVLTIAMLLPLSTVSAFSDVPEDHPYAKAINELHNDGVIKGYPDGSFGIDKPINRAEFLKILLEYSNTEVGNQTNCFPDVQDQWFAKYVCKAKELEIVKGYPDGIFRPNNHISHRETIIILIRSSSFSEELTDLNKQIKLSIPSDFVTSDIELTRGEFAHIVKNTQSLFMLNFSKYENIHKNLNLYTRDNYLHQFDGSQNTMEPLLSIEGLEPLVGGLFIDDQHLYHYNQVKNELELIPDSDSKSIKKSYWSTNQYLFYDDNNIYGYEYPTNTLTTFPHSELTDISDETQQFQYIMFRDDNYLYHFNPSTGLKRLGGDNFNIDNLVGSPLVMLVTFDDQIWGYHGVSNSFIDLQQIDFETLKIREHHQSVTHFEDQNNVYIVSKNDPTFKAVILDNKKHVYSVFYRDDTSLYELNLLAGTFDKLDISDPETFINISDTNLYADKDNLYFINPRHLLPNPNIPNVFKIETNGVEPLKLKKISSGNGVRPIIATLTDDTHTFVVKYLPDENGEFKFVFQQN